MSSSRVIKWGGVGEGEGGAGAGGGGGNKQTPKNSTEKKMFLLKSFFFCRFFVKFVSIKRKKIFFFIFKNGTSG